MKLGSPPAIRGAVVRLSVALALLIAPATSNVPSTHAVTASPDGVTAADSTGPLIGFDASFPQCGKTIPRTTVDGARYGFAVLGVYGGEAFSINHCLAQQYQDALTRGFTPDFYLDVHSATKATAIFGEYGPKGSCLADDRACASYNYGYHSAAVGFRYVETTLGWAAAVSATWWLDVETGKPWSENPAWNAQVIEGALDFFGSVGIAVGAYSIPPMWNRIVGREYRPEIPAWISGAKTPDDVPRLCDAESFTGGPILLVQQPRQTYDEDYACAR